MAKREHTLKACSCDGVRRRSWNGARKVPTYFLAPVRLSSARGKDSHREASPCIILMYSNLQQPKADFSSQDPVFPLSWRAELGTKHPIECQNGCNTAVTSLNTKLKLANYPGKWSIKAGHMSGKTTNHFPVAIRLQPQISDNSTLIPSIKWDFSKFLDGYSIKSPSNGDSDMGTALQNN